MDGARIGSWPFIGSFVLFLATWIGSNLFLAHQEQGSFDPYPFIFLNLMLSMLAAAQAPIILMSQNRQGAKDRAAANLDYEINLKAELEIMQLHEKLDDVRDEHIRLLMEQEARQNDMLEKIMKALEADKA